MGPALPKFASESQSPLVGQLDSIHSRLIRIHLLMVYSNILDLSKRILCWRISPSELSSLFVLKWMVSIECIYLQPHTCFSVVNRCQTFSVICHSISQVSMVFDSNIVSVNTALARRLQSLEIRV